jgi:hypothetical protein
MTLAEHSTHWLTVSKLKSGNPIGRGTGDDQRADPRERRSRANLVLRIIRRRLVIGDVRQRERDEQGHADEAKKILGNLALDSNSTFANKHLAEQMLAMLTRQPARAPKRPGPVECVIASRPFPPSLKSAAIKET